MCYATISDVSARLGRALTGSEADLCSAALEEAAVIIDSVAPKAPETAKRVVAVRMVLRILEAGQQIGVPAGATQGSTSALGYSQSWTMGSGGAAGELYLGKADRRLLGAGNAIGSRSPTEDLVCGE